MRYPARVTIEAGRGQVVSQPDEHSSTAHDPSEQYSTSPYEGPPQSQGFQAPDSSSTAYAQPGGYAQQPNYAAYGVVQPAPGYPANPGYPTGPGYPPPYGYPPYGYPMQRGPIRPGGATASAVLMFIQAAVVLISTFYVLFFASLAGGVSAAGVSRADSLETEFTIIGILQLVSVGLLIFGGVQLLGGSGRIVTIIACGAQLAFVLYWMIRIGSLPDFGEDAAFFFVVPLFYAVLPLVALPLALGRPVTEYLAAKQALRGTAS